MKAAPKKLSFLSVATIIFASISPVTAQNEVYSFFHDANKVRQLVFSANNKHLISKTGDELLVTKGLVASPSIQIWDLETKKKGMVISDKELDRASCFSADGKFMAFRENNMMNVMDLNTKTIISSFKFGSTRNNYAHPVAFINDNKSLIIEQGNSSSVYDLATNTLTGEYESNGDKQYISADDVYLIETVADTMILRDFQTKKKINLFTTSQGYKKEDIKWLTFSPENKFAVVHANDKIKMWDLVNARLVQSIQVSTKYNVVAISPDGRYMVGGDDTLKVWELKTQKTFPTPILMEGKITAGAFSGDGKTLACGDVKGNIKYWSFSDENVSAQYFLEEINRDIAAIPNKKEFEKTEEYDKRKNRQLRSVYNKYLNAYGEKLVSEKTFQESVYEEIERKAEEKRQKIANSRQTLKFKVENIGTYNADKETFEITIFNEEQNLRKTETIKIPRRDNAPCFKQSAPNLVVKGTKQLQDDEVTVDIFNIKIISNCSGKDKEYLFGTQKREDD